MYAEDDSALDLFRYIQQYVHFLIRRLDLRLHEQPLGYGSQIVRSHLAVGDLVAVLRWKPELKHPK